MDGCGDFRTERLWRHFVAAASIYFSFYGDIIDDFADTAAATARLHRRPHEAATWKMRSWGHDNTAAAHDGALRRQENYKDVATPQRESKT